MDNFLFFAHLTSLAIWTGALVLVFIFFQILRKQLVSKDVRNVFISLTKVFNGISHLSSVIVLVSGIVMVVRWFEGGNKPFYISFMEQAGGMAVLVSIIGLTFLGRRITKQLKSDEVKKEVTGFGPYLTVMAGAICLIVAVIFVVANKIA